MSDTVMLKAEVRQQVGSKATVKLRGEGKMPAVVYGHKKDPVSITLDAHAFVESLHHGNRIFDMDIDGAQETLLVKDIQYDYLGRDVIHADFVRVNLNEMVEVQVSIEMVGTAKGSHEGGIIDEQLDHLIVKCKVSAIPEVIRVNVTEMDLGSVLHAGEIELPEGSELVTDKDAVVLVCHEAKAALAEEGVEGEEGAAEPEVITEKKEEAGE